MAAPVIARAAGDVPAQLASPRRVAGRGPAVCGWLAATAYLVWSALTCMPTPGVDSSLFVGTAIRYAQGHGLTNPVYTGSHLDPLGQQRVVTYPPLFPWLLGAMMPHPHPVWAFLLIALMRAVQTALWGWMYSALLERSSGRKAGRHHWLIPLLIIGVVAQGATPTEGRPEALASLFVTLAVVAAWRLPASSQPPVLGFLLGLVGSTHPVGAILSACALAVYAGARMRWDRALLFLAGCGAISIVVFVAVLSSSPNGLTATLQGTTAMARSAIVPAWGNVVQFLIVNGRASFCGLLVGAGLVAALDLAARNRRSLSSPILCVAGALLFVLVMWYTAVRAPARHYNALIFAPVLFALLLVWAVRPGRRAVARGAVLAGLAALCSLGWVRYVLVLAFFSAQGVSLESARAFVRTQTATRSAGVVGVPTAGYVLFDDLDRVCAADSVAAARGCGVRLVVALPVDPYPREHEWVQAGYRPVGGLATPPVPAGLPGWAVGYAVRVYERGDRVSPPRSGLR